MDTGVFKWRQEVRRTIKQEGYDPYNSVGSQEAEDYVDIDPTVLVDNEDGSSDDHYWRTRWGIKT